MKSPKRHILLSRIPLLVGTLLAIGIAIAAWSAQAGQAKSLAVTLTAQTFLPVVIKSQSPTPTATATPTATSTPGTNAYFAVGAGSSDVIPHQIVRASDDRVYIFVSQQYSTIIRVYWTTAAGLPNAASAFSGSAQLTASDRPISVDAVYDGGDVVHVLVNAQDATLKDYPFDVTQNQFQSAIVIDSSVPTVSGDYIGTSGVSGMVDTASTLQIAYWSSGNHITHRAYTYNSATNTLAPVGSATQVDTAGSANHPAVAVSPLDNSLTVAWVSEANAPQGKILTRVRSSAGTWGAIETASTADVWTSTSAGINIDQGPSLIIGSDGTQHLAYIQDYDTSGDYGRIHYAVHSGAGWTDTALYAYTHDPALALNSRGEVYIIGHGHPKSQNTTCTSMDDMCTIKKNSNGTWGVPQLFATHPNGKSFDGSSSVKWAVKNLVRPETIEFVFFMTPYNSPTVYYGRLP